MYRKVVRDWRMRKRKKSRRIGDGRMEERSTRLNI